MMKRTSNKIEKSVVGAYNNIEKKVVCMYRRIEDAFVDTFLKGVKKLEK